MLLKPSEATDLFSRWLKESAVGAYAVFVGENITHEMVEWYLEESEVLGYRVCRRTWPLQDDKLWTFVQMDELYSMGFNFLRCYAGQGFIIWSDNVLNSKWRNNVVVRNLTIHRILSFIDAGGSLDAKHQRALQYISYDEMAIRGDELQVHVPFSSQIATFVEGESSNDNDSEKI